MERLLRAMQHTRATDEQETLSQPTRMRRSPLDRLHAHAKAKRHARRRARKDGSLGLDPEQAAWKAEKLAARYPVGYFGPEHGLTPTQAWEANRRLAKADRERPIRGRHAERRHRLRIGGILSSVKAGRSGNGAWGRSMLARRGGKAMAMHGPHILAANRCRIQAQRQCEQTWKRWQSHPPTYEDWQQVLVAWPQQERMPRDFMAW
jgi:hypothetical protein